MANSFDGQFTVATPREEAFAVLADVDNFSPLLPTYEAHELCDDGSSNVRVKIGVGKIRGTATVNLTLVENNPPVSATYAGKGSIMGGAFNLQAAFELAEQGPAETAVHWHGELVILGKLASLAGGLIQPVAKKQIQELVDAIQAALAAGSSGKSTRTAHT